MVREFQEGVREVVGQGDAQDDPGVRAEDGQEEQGG